jgi:hypothetical protein
MDHAQSIVADLDLPSVADQTIVRGQMAMASNKGLVQGNQTLLKNFKILTM